MTKTKWLVVALLAVLALGLVLAGCGGTTTTTAAPVTTAPPATTATTAPPSSETTAPPSSETTASSVVAPTETLKIGVVLQLSDW